METLESLTAKLRTTKDIQSIVRTMKSLSSVSIHHYEHAVEAIGHYERTITLGIQALLRDQPRRDGQLLTPAGDDGGQFGRADVVIGSDRGLCGRFNDNIVRFAAERLAEEGNGSGGQDGLLCVLGQRAAARFEACGHNLDKIYGLPGSIDGMAATVQSVAVDIETWTRKNRVSKVDIIFNRRSGRSFAVPTRRTVFPVPQSEIQRMSMAPWPSRSLPIYRMDRRSLLPWLLGEYLFAALYRALAESLASEHASRLAAMQGAERSIEERREDLTSTYRRKRQESITRELLDLVSGYEAVVSSTGHSPAEGDGAG